MAFTLNDTVDICPAFARDSMGGDRNLSKVRNILFESANFMPTFVRNEDSTMAAEEDDLPLTGSGNVSISQPPTLEYIAEEEGSSEHETAAVVVDSEDYEDDENELLAEAVLPAEAAERIKVFLRVRPEPMAPNYEVNPQEKVLWVKNIDQPRRQGPYCNYFKFDDVFIDSSEQWPVVEATALPLLRDLLFGENSLLFTYGITSSGKSFTMRGDRQRPGIIPTSLSILFATLEEYLRPDKSPTLKPLDFDNVEKINNGTQFREKLFRSKILNDVTLQKSEVTGDVKAFAKFTQSLVEEKTPLIASLRRQFEEATAQQMNTDKLHCAVYASYWEIYNDKFYDLLNPGKHTRRESTVTVKTVNRDDGNIFVLHGLKQVYVTSALEAYKVFLYGQESLKKHISSTALNSTSSRSHSSFNLTLIINDTASATISNLSFCDLAGRERTKKSKVNSVQLKETNNINQSLMYLGQCLSSLRSSRPNNAPTYRSSQLTKIFQPYLSGTSGRTYIIYNLNPQPALFDDSYYSLDFCNIAKKVKQAVAKPKAFRVIANTSRQSIAEMSFADDDDGELVRSLKKDVNNLTMLISSSPNEELVEQIEHLKARINELERQKSEQEMAIKTRMLGLLKENEKQFESIIEKKDAALQSVRDINEQNILFIENQHEKKMLAMKELKENLDLKIFAKEEENMKLIAEVDSLSVALEAKELRVVELEGQVHKLEETLEEKLARISNLESRLEDMEKILRQKDDTILNMRNESHSKAKKGRRGKARKSIDEDEHELLKSVAKSVSKRIDENDPPADDAVSFLGQNQYSVKKKLHMSVTKRLDTSPILSPLQAKNHIDSEKPYNTRTRNRRNLFNV